MASHQRPAEPLPPAPPPLPAARTGGGRGRGGGARGRGRSSDRDGGFSPPRRAWCALGADSSRAFTVVSYNVLAQSLLEAHEYLYPERRLRDGSLGRAPRASALRRELEGYGAAIYCLQECDPDFVDVARAAMGGGGRRSAGAFFAPCGEPRIDGALVCWDASRFALAASRAVVLDAGEGKVNACALVVLADRDGDALVVASAHLLFNPRRGDVRVRQTSAVLEEARRLRDAHGARGVLLCGDWNASPASAAYALLRRGAVDAAAADRPTRSAGNDNAEQPRVSSGHKGGGSCALPAYAFAEAAPGGLLASPLPPLASAYADPPTADAPTGEPAATTFVAKGTKGCVDYVFFGGPALTLVGRFEVLPPWLLRRGGGLPCDALASDHVALVARFSLARRRPPKKETRREAKKPRRPPHEGEGTFVRHIPTSK